MLDGFSIYIVSIILSSSVAITADDIIFIS